MVNIMMISWRVYIMRKEILSNMAKRAAAMFGKDETFFTAETPFGELGMKSVNYNQIINDLEDKYDIEIPFTEFCRQKTFGEAADFVEKLIEG